MFTIEIEDRRDEESGICLENATMIQIQDMFENGKPDIVLKTVKGFNIKRTPFMILISENVFQFVPISNTQC